MYLQVTDFSMASIECSPDSTFNMADSSRLCSKADFGNLGRNLKKIFFLKYCKVPKFSDVRKLCCNLPKIQTKRQKLKSILSK